MRALSSSRIGVAAVVLLACAAGGLTAAELHATLSRPRIQEGSFQSKALNGTVHYAVALPPGYDARRRYPVVYFLHGLPAGPQAYKAIRGLADTLAANQLKAILVGAQGARPGDTDPEWHDWGPGRRWETATARELVAQIDRRYRTLARRSGRAIVGVSAGGYGAALIGIHHPAEYDVIESWSGYFIPTDPSGTPLDLGTDADAHVAVPTLKRSFERYPNTFFGFFVGSNDPYPGFVDDNRRLSRELTQAGVPHRFRIYDGAHNRAFWNRHDDEWLTAAVRRLDAPSR